MKFIGIAIREGAELVMRGKALELKTQGNYVTPSICLGEGRLARSHAQERLPAERAPRPERRRPRRRTPSRRPPRRPTSRSTGWSPACSRKLARGLRAARGHASVRHGELEPHHALPVAATCRSAGLKKSGNHMPSGIAAAAYCMTAVSLLEAAEARLPAQLEPGLNWK